MPEASVEPEKRRSKIRRLFDFGRKREDRQHPKTATVGQDDAASNAPAGPSAPADSVDPSLNMIPENDTASSPSDDARVFISSVSAPPGSLGGEKSEAILASPEAKRYREAVDKLQSILTNARGIEQFPIDKLKVPCTVADIDAVAKSMSSAIAEFVETRKKLTQNKSKLRGIVETCYRTSMPFVQGSLNIAAVQTSTQALIGLEFCTEPI